MLANRIPPDVAGYGFDGIGRTKHVIVVTFFPETIAREFPKFEGGVLFEEADELAEIGVWRGALPLCQHP